MLSALDDVNCKLLDKGLTMIQEKEPELYSLLVHFEPLFQILQRISTCARPSSEIRVLICYKRQYPKPERVPKLRHNGS
jgi:hypothetical protein